MDDFSPDDINSPEGLGPPLDIMPPIDIQPPADIIPPTDIEPPIDIAPPPDIMPPIYLQPPAEIMPPPDIQPITDVTPPADIQPPEISKWTRMGIEDLQGKLGKDTLWDDTPIGRGRNFEVLKDANLAGNFPTIDDINPDSGTATSLKSLDVTADTYQDINQLDNKVKVYVDDLGNFDDTTWNGTTVQKNDIQEFKLDLAIPSDAASPEQVQSLKNMQEYAKEKGVSMVVTEVP